MSPTHPNLDYAAAWPDRTLFFQWHRGERRELYNSCAVRTQRYKLVNGRELYDPQEDPVEAHDIAATGPGRLEAALTPEGKLPIGPHYLEIGTVPIS